MEQREVNHIYIYYIYIYKYPYIDSMLFRHDMGHVAESQAELAGPVQATLCQNKPRSHVLQLHVFASS